MMDHGMSMAPSQGGDAVVGTAIIVIGTLGTLVTLILAFRATLWPGESAPDHPKRIILKDDR
jgi:hypothetical protein